jgi:hypothetical protein
MELIYLIMFFGWFSLMLHTSGRSGGRKTPMPPEHLRPKKNSMPTYDNPPPPPKRKRCICNIISEHTPGGRCEANHSRY